jgi:hypothetical protein
MNESAVTVHANFMTGNENKMAHMKEYGVWIADNGKCNNYLPPTIPENGWRLSGSIFRFLQFILSFII